MLIVSKLVLPTESETPTSEYAKVVGSEVIKPHELRALNFLVNEYLLRHNYKLTSITFADENEGQVPATLFLYTLFINIEWRKRL